MIANQIMFILFSAVIIVFSILTVTSRRILRAAAVSSFCAGFDIRAYISC